MQTCPLLKELSFIYRITTTNKTAIGDNMFLNDERNDWGQQEKPAEQTYTEKAYNSSIFPINREWELFIAIWWSMNDCKFQSKKLRRKARRAAGDTSQNVHHEYVDFDIGWPYQKFYIKSTCKVSGA